MNRDQTRAEAKREAFARHVKVKDPPMVDRQFSAGFDAGVPFGDRAATERACKAVKDALLELYGDMIPDEDETEPYIPMWETERRILAAIEAAAKGEV